MERFPRAAFHDARVRAAVVGLLILSAKGQAAAHRFETFRAPEDALFEVHALEAVGLSDIRAKRTTQPRGREEDDANLSAEVSVHGGQ